MKFVVEADKDMDKDDVSTCLHNMDHYAFGTFKVTELKPPPEVRKVETGVLNVSPLIHVGTSANVLFTGGNTVDLSKYPELKPLCINIRTEWDFSSIPVGSLIRIGGCTDVWDIGIVEKINGDTIKVRSGNQGAIEWSSDNIKSIRIIEVGEK